MSDQEVDLGAAALVPTPPPRQPKTFREAKRQAKTLVAEVNSLLLVPSRKCHGKVRLRADMTRRAGPDNPHLRDDAGNVLTRPCKNSAIRGGFVCPTHGARAPQVKAKAERRLLAMVEPSLIALEALIQQDEHLPTKLGAIRTVLERAGSAAIGPLQKEAAEKDMRPIINIGIAAGGVPSAPPQITVSTNLQLKAAPVEEEGDVEGELIDDEEVNG